MREKLIRDIESEMLSVLDNKQLEKLRKVLNHCLYRYEIEEKSDVNNPEDKNNDWYLSVFMSAKRVEGCSEKTLKYYESTIKNMLKKLEKEIKHITTDDLRGYLDFYFIEKKAGRITMDNIRRIFSTFFSWLEDEDYIIKSPVRRIRKVKSGYVIKETYTDEALELMRDSVSTSRDLALIDILSSTGMRVGELVRINIEDVDFENREIIVFGKGNRERKVYFDARTKIHLKRYIDERTDDNEALFVSLFKPHRRLQISGVEIRLRELGKKLGLNKVHPHKFRRTLATKAIDKGMPIEQVQHLLGHQKIDTTLQYAMVDQGNVKASHKRYLA